MKKFTSLILSLALGMSAFPALSQTFAQSGSVDLYEKFLQQLDQKNENTSPAADTQSEASADVQPELISAPAPKPVVLKDEGMVSITGTVVRVNPLYLKIDPKKVEFTQIGSKFKAFPTDKKVIYVLLTSGDKDITASLLKAAGNDSDNYVQITGWGVDKDYDGYMDGVSVNGDSAGVWNLADASNPFFDKEMVEMKPFIDRTPRQYYAEFRLEQQEGRVQVLAYMLNRNGEPIDWDGNVITNYEDSENPAIRQVRIAYNEENIVLSGQKEVIWKTVVDLGNRYRNDDTIFVIVGFNGFIGKESTGAFFARVNFINEISEVKPSLSPEEEEVTRPAAPIQTSVEYQAPEEVTPEPVSGTVDYAASIKADLCFHDSFINLRSGNFDYIDNKYTLYGSVPSTSTDFMLSGDIINGKLGNAFSSGSVAGFNNVSVSLVDDVLSMGNSKELPGECPYVLDIKYSF